MRPAKASPPILTPRRPLPPLIDDVEAPNPCTGDMSDTAAQAADTAMKAFRHRQGERLDERIRIRAEDIALEQRETAAHLSAFWSGIEKEQSDWEKDNEARDLEIQKRLAEHEELQIQQDELVEQHACAVSNLNRETDRQVSVQTLIRHAIRLQDEVTCLLERILVLHGPYSLGNEALDTFVQSAVIDDPPPGYAFVPIDEPFSIPSSSIGPARSSSPLPSPSKAFSGSGHSKKRKPEDEPEGDSQRAHKAPTRTKPSSAASASRPRVASTSHGQQKKETFDYTVEDMLADGLRSEADLPPNSRPRNDYTFKIPPGSCFGELHPFPGILQEDFPDDVAAHCLAARVRWCIWKCKNDIEMATWASGRSFMMKLLENSLPRLDDPLEENAIPWKLGDMPFPVPYPQLDKDDFWRSIASFRVPTFSQVLELSGELLSADKEQNILNGLGRVPLEPVFPTPGSLPDLFRFLPQSAPEIKKEVEENEAKLLHARELREASSPHLPPTRSKSPPLNSATESSMLASSAASEPSSSMRDAVPLRTSDSHPHSQPSLFGKPGPLLPPASVSSPSPPVVPSVTSDPGSFQSNRRGRKTSGADMVQPSRSSAQTERGINRYQRFTDVRMLPIEDDGKQFSLGFPR
ncbi:hypothetical protein C8R46DRAFT_1223042 [Mycena filopes]|nr:hypothetical protein C8R46DRAFT_1223042 [Mycena filopes]